MGLSSFEKVVPDLCFVYSGLNKIIEIQTSIYIFQRPFFPSQLTAVVIQSQAVEGQSLKSARDLQFKTIKKCCSISLVNILRNIQKMKV